MSRNTIELYGFPANTKGSMASSTKASLKRVYQSITPVARNSSQGGILPSLVSALPHTLQQISHTQSRVPEALGQVWPCLAAEINPSPLDQLSGEDFSD